ncbi:endonuclease V [Flavobacterium sp. RNTU_13]|uniref:endonuclease V n=1 Tax=Flavobacterium sp. RNTU_13 TaxID=3375145 RepID=UPI003985A838
MILAIDVYYYDNQAKAVGVLFEWEDAAPRQTIIAFVDDVAEYIPGEFYKRELPCIKALLQKTGTDFLDAVIVDGHIYTDNNGSYGLGGKTFELLGKRIPVIGIAKTGFHTNKDTVIEVHRGESKNPLYVSAIGIDTLFAADKIRNMQGPYRIPDILKTLDMVTKDGSS